MAKCAICKHEAAGGVVVHRGCLKAKLDMLKSTQKTMKIVFVMNLITLGLLILNIWLQLK